MKQSILLCAALILTLTPLFSQKLLQLNFDQINTSDANTWSVQFIYDPKLKPVEVSLHLAMQHKDKGDIMLAETKSFSLNGTTVALWTDIIQSLGKKDIHPDFKNGLSGIEKLPLGDYQLCLMLELSNSGKIVLENCFSFSVENDISQFLLIEPANSDTIYQQYPIYSWIPLPSPGKIQPTYTLFLYEIEPGQSPEVAVAKNQPYYFVKGINAPVHTPVPGSKLLQAGQHYAWQVIGDIGKINVPSNIEDFVFGIMKPEQGMDEGIMYFQLTAKNSTDFYNLNKPEVHFIYVNDNSQPTVTYQIFNGEGQQLAEGSLEAAYGFNLFSIDLSDIGMKADTFCKLIIGKQQEPDQHLQFIYHPEK